MTLATIETLISHWVTLFKAHEKFLAYLLLAAVSVYYCDRGFKAFETYEKGKQTADNAQIQALHDQNKASAEVLAELIADMDARFKADETKIANAKTTIVVQQKKNDAMTPPELYTHWQSDLALPEGSITPQKDGTAIVSIDAAHATVNEIDKVAPLTEQLIATQDELKGCTAVTNQQNIQIAGITNELAAEKKGRADDAVVAKVEKKKTFWNGTKFGAGLVIAAQIAIKLLK